MTSIVWNTKQGRPKGNFPLSATGKKSTYMRWVNLRKYSATFMKGMSRKDSSLSSDERSIWLCDSHTYWRKHNAGAIGWS